MNKIAFILLLMFSSSSIIPQDYKTSFLREKEISSGFVLQTWSAGDERITEYVVPLLITIPISKSFVIRGSSSSASANLTSAENRINGFTDSRVSFSLVTMKNQLLITGGVTIPSGKTTLEGDQSLVASALALYPLDFRVPSFGQGLSVNASGVFAFEIGEYIAGCGAGFVYKDGFKPFKNRDSKYQPGMELSLNVGGETKPRSSNMKLLLDITYTLYGADKFENTEVFKSGGKFLIDLRSQFKLNRSDLILYLRERTKSRNDKGMGDLVTEEKNSNGNQLEFGSLIFIPTSEFFGLKGDADIKYYFKNGYESNGAFIFGIGGGFNFSMSRNIAFDLLLKYYTGSLLNKSESTTISGIEASGGIKITL